MLLEVVEKLLALLIIVAMLILVMFLALPDSRQRADRGDPEPTTRERVVIQQAPEREVTPVPTPEPEAEPEPATPAQPSGSSGNGKIVVPDPRSRTQQVQKEAPEMKEAPASSKEGLAQKQDNGRSEVAAKQPKRQDRLPMTASEPVHTPKSGKIKPKVKTETVVVRKAPEPESEPVYRTQQTRTTVQSRSRPYVKKAKYRDRWDRTDYYECEGGRCDCSCEQPYWARSGPCWN